MEIRTKLNLQISLPTATLDTSTSVDVFLVFRSGKWQGECLDPPVFTPMADTMEEAIVLTAREIGRELARGAGVAD